MKVYKPNKIALNDSTEDTVRLLVEDGRRIEAVKVVKDAVGCGLTEAKDYIDATYSLSKSKTPNNTGVTMDMLVQLSKQFRDEFGDLAQFLGMPITQSPKIGRNEPCHCGSGKKYKKCCGANI